MTAHSSPFPSLFFVPNLCRNFSSLIRRQTSASSDVVMVAGASLALPLLALALAWPGSQRADSVAWLVEAICMSKSSSYEGRPLGTTVPISSEALPNVPGKRITVVRVTYPPGGYTPPHRHAGSVTAYVTAGSIRSQLAGGPLETFAPGQSFFEPPGAFHIVSENASMTEPAELIAIFVADEGATLTIFD